MDHKEVVVFIGAIIILAGLIYYLGNPPQPEPEISVEEYSASLYLKAIERPMNYTDSDYHYSYEELVDGYRTTTTLTKKGDLKLVSGTSPVAKREVYFIGNETIFCVEFKGERKCSNAYNVSILEEYSGYVEGLFFNKENINKTLNDRKHMINKSVYKFSNETQTKIVNGHNCTLINYTVDYSVLTIIEARNLGVNSAVYFYASYCIDPETGETYEKYFNMPLGRAEEITFTLLDSRWGDAPEIVPPDKMDDINDTLDIFAEEVVLDSELMTCYQKPENEFSICINELAVDYSMPSLCTALDSEKHDTCVMNVAMFRGDETLCPTLKSEEKRDDCYFEIGARKQSPSICENIVDEKKKTDCLQLCVKEPEILYNETEMNVTGNATG